MRKQLLLFITLLLFGFNSYQLRAQSATGSNVISTAVPFLTIAPDSRGAALGETGVATSPDVNSQYWNSAKYAFFEQEMGLSLSYSPWMRSVVSDMSLSYLTYFAHIADYQTLSTSLRYFSYGSMPFYDAEGILQSYQNPNEFALDFAYAIKLSRCWSGSVVLRYIRSDMASGSVGGIEMSPTNAFAADIAFYYRKETRRGRRSNAWNLGAVFSNIGTPISYDDGVTKNYLPANMRIGGAYELSVDRYNKINFSLDFNKLMVPTTNYVSSTTNDDIIIATNHTSDYGVMGSIFRSFTDAPGGLKEELQEITSSIGVEYMYNDQFAVRTGFFNENENKGGRKYLTFGAGLTLYSFTFDMSYLYTLSTTSPLENTIRFTLSFDFGG
ncbi:MAG: type IX secretion system outer membrane channel protein PorV [Mangrovibacterium sp.]